MKCCDLFLIISFVFNVDDSGLVKSLISLTTMLFFHELDADNSDHPVGVSDVCDGADDNEACQTWTWLTLILLQGWKEAK